MTDTLRVRALKLLARREHARSELARKLAPHAGSAEELDALLDELSARRLLSDARYAEMRLHGRAARFGNARLAQELRMQGVADELIDSALADAGSELERAHAVWQRKFGGDPAPRDLAERNRQMRFLMSRGFGGETIRRVLRSDFDEIEQKDE